MIVHALDVLPAIIILTLLGGLAVTGAYINYRLVREVLRNQRAIGTELRDVTDLLSTTVEPHLLLAAHALRPPVARHSATVMR